jgi:hypothetical protein
LDDRVVEEKKEQEQEGEERKSYLLFPSASVIG